MSCWARLMRASGGISKPRNSMRPRRPVGAVGGIELVDADFRPMRVAGHVGEDVAQQAVEQPWPRRLALARLRDLRQRDLELVEAVVARLVDPRRLAGRPDEQAGEEIAEARMPQPVNDEALQQVGTPEEGTVERRRPADHDMIAAAGSRMLAVDHELVGPEPRLPRLLVDRLGRRHAFAPVRRGVNVHLDDARVGRDADHVEARIARRGVALDLDRESDPLGRRFRRRDQLEIILEPLHRRHEDAQAPVARLDRDRGADRAVDVAEPLLDAFLARAGRQVRGEEGDLLGLPHQRLAFRQRLARRGRIGVEDIGKGRRRNIGKRAERQAIADRAVAGREVEAAAAGLPYLAAPPSPGRLRLPALDRQHVAGRLGQSAREDARDPLPLFRVLELGVLRRHVLRQIAFLDDPLRRVLVGRRDIGRIDAEFARDRAEQRLRLVIARGGLLTLGGDQPGVAQAGLPSRRQ